MLGALGARLGVPDVLIDLQVGDFLPRNPATLEIAVLVAAFLELSKLVLQLFGASDDTP